MRRQNDRGVVLEEREDRSNGLVQRRGDPGDVREEFETLEPPFVKTIFAEGKRQTAAGRQPLQCRRRLSCHWRCRGYAVPRSALLGGDQIVHCRGDAALAVWHTRQFERHLNCRQGSEDHRLVQIAEMADAEDVPLEPVESSTERNVELVEAELAHLV